MNDKAKINIEGSLDAIHTLVLALESLASDYLNRPWVFHLLSEGPISEIRKILDEIESQR